MLEAGQDAAEKFDGLCECEKFMVSMMTVKHAKRKVQALLFKMQFMSCLESIAEGETSWSLSLRSFLCLRCSFSIFSFAQMHAWLSKLATN